ncbi:class I adenylate-forming enzyme family protein [Pseudohongiella spirulinae]|uniref:Long-chain acyl-CoA synthetase protein n=1 Tax=Pseudohongiella spirulinae TaxID=1249552 RepID=A0A0S2K9Q4_9GAMM|nr:AMP-binding protein [Pseudohongiella spirulinae]ALO45068.1 Long-chain acyl-CoA synthetase protein [Pseudohongiella spirulinae]
MSDLQNMPAVPDESIPEIVERHVAEAPDAPCLYYLGVTLTISQINDLANRLANRMRELGIERGDVIGLHLPNSPQYVIGLLAAAKLGCPASGVSPLLKADEIVYQVANAHIRLLISLDQLFAPLASKLDGRLPTVKAVMTTGPIDFLPGWKKWLAGVTGKVPKVELPDLTHIRTVNFWPDVKKANNSRVFEPCRLEDVFMIQYTGGTTGNPKGAELSLHNIMSNVIQNETVSSYDVGKETFATVLPWFHIAGLSALFMGLRKRALMIVVPNPRDVKSFCQAMLKHPPTVLGNVPTLYQMLLEEPLFKKVDFSRLKIAVSGAAPAPVELIRKVEEIIGQGKYCEAYGLTETSPTLTMNPPGRARPGTIGLPLPGTDIRIVDAETGKHEMPVDEPGELIARGPQVFRGYLGLPEESNKALRSFDGKTYFYTGDVAKKDQDGYITICDRAKDMLIVGGYKVFSVEVENKLKELEEIELSAVIGTPDEERPGNDIVNLYVQLSKVGRERGDAAVKEKILAYCRDTMAPFKVPKYIHIVAQIPLTPVGKVDKKALRK